jgi:spoIIIJ-associated protein
MIQRTRINDQEVSMEYIEMEGKTVDDAINKVCAMMDVKPENLDVEVMEKGTGAMTGFGMKRARIKAKIKTVTAVVSEPAAPAMEAPKRSFPKREPRRDIGNESLRDVDKETPREFSREPSREAPKRSFPRREPTPRVASPMGDDEMSHAAPREAPRRSFPRRELPPVADIMEEDDDESLFNEGDDYESSYDDTYEDEEDATDVSLSEVRRDRSREESDPALKEEMLKATAVLEEILKLLHFELKVTAFFEDGAITLDVEKDMTNILIGKRGETLDALQYLVNRIINKDTNEDKRRVVVDIGGYRMRKNKSLVLLAKKTSSKVKACGRPISITPMNSHDRRIIHITLEKDKDVRTESFGEGPLKRVVVFPMSNGGSTGTSSGQGGSGSRNRRDNRYRGNRGRRG